MRSPRAGSARTSCSRRVEPAAAAGDHQGRQRRAGSACSRHGLRTSARRFLRGSSVPTVSRYGAETPRRMQRGIGSRRSTGAKAGCAQRLDDGIGPRARSEARRRLRWPSNARPAGRRRGRTAAGRCAASSAPEWPLGVRREAMDQVVHRHHRGRALQAVQRDQTVGAPEHIDRVCRAASVASWVLCQIGPRRSGRLIRCTMFGASRKVAVAVAVEEELRVSLLRAQRAEAALPRSWRRRSRLPVRQRASRPMRAGPGRRHDHTGRSQPYRPGRRRWIARASRHWT